MILIHKREKETHTLSFFLSLPTFFFNNNNKKHPGGTPSRSPLPRRILISSLLSRTPGTGLTLFIHSSGKRARSGTGSCWPRRRPRRRRRQCRRQQRRQPQQLWRRRLLQFPTRLLMRRRRPLPGTWSRSFQWGRRRGCLSSRREVLLLLLQLLLLEQKQKMLAAMCTNLL